MNKRLILLMAIIVVAALTRLIPHPPNVTPIAAMALFGGACLGNRKLAYLIPIAAMLLSDLVLACTRYNLSMLLSIQPLVYACILATTAIGQLIGDRRSVPRVVAASLAGSLLFFVVTNFGTWATGTLYPMTPSGLAVCYTAAIPFFRNSLLGDLAFTTVLFGGMALLESRVVWMRDRKPSVLA
jgi:hypothetical protein